MPSIFEVGIFLKRRLLLRFRNVDEFLAITSPTLPLAASASVWYNSDCVMACIKFIWRIIEEQNSGFRNNPKVLPQRNIENYLNRNKTFHFI